MLICAILRSTAIWRAAMEGGLANYLAGLAMPESVFQKTDVDGLYFMASGPLPPNPAELLAGPKMLSLLSTASEKVDAVIIDLPPILGLADAPLLASIAAGTLLVVATGQTRRSVVKGGIEAPSFCASAHGRGAHEQMRFPQELWLWLWYGYGYGADSPALEYYGYGQKKALAQVEDLPRG